jgi:diguanylate cyclase (GGDEF)-like protein/putative nucleotidyltransferase with HDIG domain
MEPVRPLDATQEVESEAEPAEAAGFPSNGNRPRVRGVARKSRASRDRAGAKGSTNGQAGAKGSTNGQAGAKGSTNGHGGAKGSTNGHGGAKGSTNGHGGAKGSTGPLLVEAIRLPGFEVDGEMAPAGPPDGVLADEVLSGITHLLVSEDSPHRVLEAVADALAELIPHDTLTLCQADLPLRLLRPILIRDLDESRVNQFLAMGPVPFGYGITGLVATTGIPELVNDSHLDVRAERVPNLPEHPESMVAIPLLARDQMKGVLCLYRIGEDRRFTLGEFKLAILFSELAALAIDSAETRTRLEAEVVTDHLTALYNHRLFHERLAEEIRRSVRQQTASGLVLFDIDDFKRVNDTYGHLVGDQVLQGVASVSRETCRSEDVIARIGGEEFGVILPGSGMNDALALAERLRRAIRSVSFPLVGQITISLGVAASPLHASSPRELIACADLALLEAKAKGKDRVRAFVEHRSDQELDDLLPTGTDGHASEEHEGMRARLATLAARGELRSVAHLRALQSLSARLNQLNDVRQIGEAITAELRTLIDYHNCRVFLLHPDGETLLPIAFQGVLSEYQGESFDALVTKVGEGLTGHVAETRESYYSPDADHDPFAITIAGTPDLAESILAVPMVMGDRLVGVVVLSKLGVEQFDEEDMRLLEALSANAAIALENARLLQVEHDEAVISGALLQLSQALTRVHDADAVMGEAIRSIPSLIRSAAASAWIRDPQTGDFTLIRRHVGGDAEGWRDVPMVPGELAQHLLITADEPFLIRKEVMATVPPEFIEIPEISEVLVAPMRWDPDGLGVFVIVAESPTDSFGERDLRLARGMADITSLALGNAQRFVDLERAYVSTVEALANAVEAKDEYTSDHCRALAGMSMTVGEEMGLRADRLKMLELGALFHDIGKIGVPSDIIRKPGPLTAAERREMNRHPEIGAQILAPVPFLQPVRPIVEASHERWDGNGYLHGLRGEEIPLEARIVFVCDAFHAMTTDRPYRDSLGEKEAIRRLKLSSGTQFDPNVVAVFVHLHRQGRIHFH